MIRLTREENNDWSLVRLEGVLNQDAAELVRQECSRPAEAGRCLLIDLRDLKSADQAGLRLLRELMARPEVELRNCSPLWLTLIKGPPG
jgi:ABC-type transporter Mla MlaB component